MSTPNNKEAVKEFFEKFHKPNNKDWREEIEKIVAVHYGAGVMIATMEGKCTDGVIDLRDKMTKELQDFIASERKIAQEEERERIKDKIENIKGDVDTTLPDVIIYNTALEDALTVIDLTTNEVEK